MTRGQGLKLAMMLAPTVLMWIVIAFLLSGCGTTGQALNCAGWRSIHPSRQDVLTRGTKEQIVAHNEFGVKQGCWPEP